jgi:hypothetical protein
MTLHLLQGVTYIVFICIVKVERKVHLLDCIIRKPERNRPPGRSRHRWEDNIRMYPKEIGWEGVGLDASGSG